MISTQKANHSTFFIIKHHLNEFEFCLPILSKRFTQFYQPKKHSYEDLGNNTSFNVLMIASSLFSRNSFIFSHSNFRVGSI
ncbi:hypothetical protein EGM89_06480 [Helicobacter pylori]|uniref:Uncharacterized protein n=1 Tax=Helicobacter pylori TaxID=210 RepID=A0AB74KKM9_HELPX|nr:hypothetical protein EGM89_06480 [Helicobacter pylori]TLR89901.1 hypothetical protein EGM90_05630 [Helicobacter pylori]